MKTGSWQLFVLVLAISALLGTDAGETGFALATEVPENATLVGKGSFRIYNGYSNSVGYSWLALLVEVVSKSDVRALCAATMISRRWALTAAHCLAGRRNVALAWGGTNLKSETFTVSLIDSAVVHPGYKAISNNKRSGTDAALIRLTSEISISPVSLNKGSRLEKVGRYLRTTGWGYTYDDVESDITVQPSELQEVVMEVLPRSQCLTRLGSLPSGFMCAGTSSGWQGVCSGDSGGPMHTLGCQVGIVSYMLEHGCDPDYPYKVGSGYQKVSTILSWVKKYVSVKSCS